MAGFRRRRRGFRRTRRTRVRRFIRKIRRVAKGTIRRLAEVKWANNNVGPYTFSNGNLSIQEITPQILQGTTKGTRIGNRIRYKFLSVDLAFNITNDGVLSSTGGYLLARVAIVQARATNLTTTDLLGSAGIDTSNVWQTFDGTNVRVLKDWRPVIPVSFSAIDFNKWPLTPIPHLKLRQRLRNNVTIKPGDAISSDPKDRFYIVAGFASSDFTNIGTIRSYTRLSFIDI